MKKDLSNILSNENLSEIDKNNLILDLAETQDMDLYKDILNYLDEDSSNSYMSICVYALTFYPAEPLLERAIHWLVNGNFDIAHNAFNILNNIEEISGKQVDDAFNYLTKSQHKNHEGWRKELINEVINMFD